jgi:hypothetical protein
MRRAVVSIGIVLVGLAVVSPALAASSPSAALQQSCLDCHGPFDKLIEATAAWKAPSGEKTSPHRYVPHTEKTPSDVPDCKNCHPAHPLSPPPAAGSIDMSKVPVDWCYKTCHHEKTFEPCKKCHKTDGR